MSLYNQMPVRLAASLVSTPPVTPVDSNTGQPVQFWRAQSTAIQFAVFDASGNIVDLSNVTSLTLTIQDGQSALAPLITKSITAGSITPTIAKADWDAGIAAQAEFDLSDADTDFSLGGSTSKPYWLVVAAKMTGGGTIYYVAGYITVYDPGVPAVQPSTAVVSRNAQSNNTGSSTVTPGSQLHTEVITITGAAGTRDIVVLAAGLVAGAHCALRFVLPAVAGINVRVFDQSTSGALLTTISSTADGFTPAARVELEYDGANWNRDFLIIPAFGQQS